MSNYFFKKILATFIAVVLAFSAFTAGIVMTSAAPMFGDVDNSGDINSTDALMCMQQSVGMVDFVGDGFDSMDVSGDGKVNSYDALKILKLSVGEIDRFN